MPSAAKTKRINPGKGHPALKCQICKKGGANLRLRPTIGTPWRHHKCWKACEMAFNTIRDKEELFDRLEQLQVYEDAMMALQSASKTSNEALKKLDGSLLKSGALSRFF